ncbi:MAG: translocation/assembly module TamB domain-containing protein, partial [Gammaproteobacteria bacterium]
LDGERRFEGIEVEALDVEALAGSIAAGGRVEWLPATRWTAEVLANGIDPATLFAEWPGKLSARLDTSGGIENGALAARADIGRLEGELRGYPVLASGQVEWLNGDLSIDALKINSGNTRFTADGTVGEALDLAWSLHSENLAEVYPRAGGSLDVEGFLRGSRETPRLEAGIEGASVSFAEIRLGKVAGRVAIDPLQAERFDIDLAAEDVRIGQRQFGRIYVEAGPQSIDAQMTNDLGTTDMVLEGSLDGLAWRGKLASLTIETNEFSNWKLAEPAALYLSIENSSLARSCLLGEQRGRFCSAWSGNQRDWKLENDIEKLPLQLLSNRVPRELNLQEGEITAQTRLQKREGAPLTGSISVDIDSGAAQYRLDSGETLNLAYREVDLDLAPGPDGIGVDGRLLLENGDTLELEGQLPGTYLLELDEGFRDLRATLRGRLEGLENIDALVPYVDALAGRLEFDLEIGGSLEQPILSGNASLSDARVNIPDADLAIGSLNLVAQADGRRNISYRANAEVLEGRFEASGEIRLDPKGGWPGSVSLQGKDFIPRGFLALWLPEEVDVDGRFDGSADLQFGAAIGLQGEVEIVSNRGVILYPLLEGELDSLDYHDASARVVVDESGISGESRVSTKEGISFAGRFELPDARLLDLDPDNQPVEGNARLEVQQLQLLQLLSFDIERPQGSYELDIEASGTLAKPRLAAQARLSDGEVGIPRLGIRVTGISMTGTTKENNRFDFAIDARSGEGYLRIEGSSVLDAASGWPTRIEINGNDFEAARIPEASVDLSPALVVVIEGRSIDISGDLRVPFARLQPRDITTAEKVSSDAVVIGGDEDVEPGWLVTTRVNLILGERVMFYGYGFDGRLTGRLLIEQQPGQLTSGTGEIGIPEGRYRAYGQRLDIENGRVLFTGGPVTNPGLDIRATRDSNGIITGLLVRGRLRQPQIELFSIPTMGQTDILSYLLFGRPLETASGEDSALMAQAALTLGLAGGDQIARSLRERFGLDDFRVETADSGDQASLIVGRYLSPDVYVSYAVGLIESANSLNLRYRITDHWQIEAESGTYHGADILYTIER